MFFSGAQITQMYSRKLTGKTPASSSNLIADDGDDLHFCSTCAFASACLAIGYGKPELTELHCLVEHVDSHRAGDFVFRTGDPFRALFAVRS
ncbi:MAG: hypothetical protein L0H75_11180, partial [Nitrosospira sp.]|nr:hypothetical protein [Nitrosospira sp.]